jgi:hypothetical protein
MKDHYTLPWEKWDRLARPKALGGWGLKNIFIFSKALAAKACWRLFTTSSLWTQVVTHKYINPDSVGDWICRADKSLSSCSIIWKAVIKSFHVIGDGLAWKVGRGDQVHIGTDPWPGSGNTHSLPQEILDHLHTQGYYKLNQIVDPGSTNIWHQGWYNSDFLELEGELKLHWDNYIFSLQRGHIRLLDKDDELVWKKSPHGVYSPKLGYIALNVDLLQREPCWWWSGLCVEFNAAARAILPGGWHKTLVVD